METTLWAKLPDGLTESAELIVTGPDDFRTEEDLRAEKFLPLVYTDAPTEPLPRGWFWNARYHVVDENVVQFWVEEKQELPPRVFSKLKVIEKADELGLAAELIEMLRGNALLYEKWSAAVNLREDNASFASGLALVKQATGLTDEQIAGILDACVAD